MPEPIPSGDSEPLSRDDLIAIVDALLKGTVDETDQYDLVDQLGQASRRYRPEKGMHFGHGWNHAPPAIRERGWQITKIGLIERRTRTVTIKNLRREGVTTEGSYPGYAPVM